MALSVIRTLSITLTLCLLSFEAASVPLRARDLLEGAETVFDVTTLGCKPDGVFDNTMAMIKAWNTACKSPGPARLLFPPGNFLCGEIVFQGPCTGPMVLDIQGNITATSDLSVYTDGVWFEIEAVDGITVTGGGVFDGKGEEVWQYAPKNGGGDALLPVSFQFSKCNNSIIQNMNVVNSKGFHTKVTWSSNITVTDLTITAPGDSPNTDGLHISTSTNVNVTNLIIKTGDDCISIGDGNTNVNVHNVTCGPGHGISVGSLGKRPQEKDVKGVTVTNCTLTNTTNGARIKTYHDSPHITATGIVYEDIVMNNVAYPIIIDQHYFSKQSEVPSNVAISDVHFRKIRGTTISKVAVTFNCSEAVPCKDIELTDINLVPIAAGDPAPTSTCFNAKPTIQGVEGIDTAGTCMA